MVEAVDFTQVAGWSGVVGPVPTHAGTVLRMPHFRFDYALALIRLDLICRRDETPLADYAVWETLSSVDGVHEVCSITWPEADMADPTARSQRDSQVELLSEIDANDGFMLMIQPDLPSLREVWEHNVARGEALCAEYSLPSDPVDALASLVVSSLPLLFERLRDDYLAALDPTRAFRPWNADFLPPDESMVQQLRDSWPIIRDAAPDSPQRTMHWLYSVGVQRKALA